LVLQLFSIEKAAAVKLDINIYNSFDITSIDFTPLSGKYALEADEGIIRDFNKADIVNITPFKDSILLQINHHNVGVYKDVSFYGRGFINAFTLSATNTKIPTRSYDDNLRVKNINGKLQLINNVDLEHYVAGVVQSEGGGSSDDIQFFFVQAISCRTYALVNYLKHTVDGYNLCDEVHCQYYTGRCENSDITRAVARTSGEVIVDSNYRMISAAFSSNCGGETVNSEDVWSLSTSYLRSVQDTFCTSMSKAKWEIKIPKNDFLNTLSVAYNFPLNDTAAVDSALNFKQTQRKVLFVNNIPLKLIRKEFMLRSTFFSTETKGDTVYFHGRGFGHGVGLCQQGAIKMAELGYDYHDIIKYYYKNTHVVHYSELKYNFMPQF
jgi:stage II sporulation protein D